MNLNAEFPFLMRFYLLQDYKIDAFLHPGKIHALNGRSDSTPTILTLPQGIRIATLILGLRVCFHETIKIRT